MAIFVLEEGPKNLVVLANTGGGTLTVAALSPPCAGLVLVNVKGSADAAGGIAGPVKTVWTLAAGDNSASFRKFGGIKDADGNWVLTISAGTVVLTFQKVRAVAPFPN